MNFSITPEARTILLDELDGKILRISFTTGCGGSGFRMASADGAENDDSVITVDDVTVALDSMSASQLTGATIRYSEDEDGYVLDHPNAVTAVWCG